MDYEKLTEDEFADLYGKLDYIESWCKSLRMHAYNMAVAGKPPKGYKLVQGRKGARKYVKDVSAIYEAQEFSDQLFEKVMASPAKAEKVFKKHAPDVWEDALAPLITQDEGKPVLVPQDDPRPPIDDCFNDLDEDLL
jgi:hypothetical protein